MNMDFEAIVKALKEIAYSGWFTLEADQYLRDFDASNVFDGVQTLAATARKLARMYEQQ